MEMELLESAEYVDLDGDGRPCRADLLACREVFPSILGCLSLKENPSWAFFGRAPKGNYVYFGKVRILRHPQLLLLDSDAGALPHGSDV